MSGVNFTSSAPKRSRSSSPVEDALESITFTSPKRVLSWWWSTFSTMGESWSTSGSGPSRLSFAQSTAMRMRWSASGGTRRSSPSSFMNAYSPGSGASPTSSICVSLPSCSSASAVASIEPSASPSGFSCVVTRKRSPPRIAAAAWASSVSIVVVWGELIDQLGHPDPPLDRWIVFERQLGSAFHPQLAREARLQHSVRSCETLQAALALALRAEHRDEDAAVTNPIRGSFSSGSVAPSTSLIDSFTRRIRSVTRDHHLALHGHELVLLAVQVSNRVLEQLLELAVLARDTSDREPGALPELVVVDLRDRGTEAVLELRLRRLHVLALALQRAGLGEVQLDREDADVAGAHVYRLSSASRSDE